MNRAIDDMQHQGGLVEFPTRKPLANLLLGGIALFAISFVATWYRVWWDSIIGLVVTILGYYSIRNENLVPMGLSFDMAYFGSILSFLLHGVAFGIIAGELSVKHVLTIVKLDNPPPPGLLIFVLVVELILLGYSGVVMSWYYKFRAEIKHTEAKADQDYRELI
ncbi:hypothetical protein H257_09215 [Aphanomyces astaci]|uniref:Uncharacterized protein n=1 Tax=Aphanomyces astaci TaxID=112090 RepID=W4GAR1_APHAT|nr:hypothetical protein H257_09215 [Aphanomyces astaci]ETV76755.1 hypothetical protein H257_09215 [Aphanomyces astaci]|eukprot:XP_009833667.1 hypothetical protein H257_09215 [Aphanomyces astaci]